MNLPYLIAQKIVRNRRKSFSRFIIRLATIATTLSVAVMIIAVAVVFGFKETIKDKMFVFWGQIHVTRFNPNPTSIIAPEPVDFDSLLYQQISQTPGVTSVQPYIVKPAILNAHNLMEGIKLKGITAGYSLSSAAAMRIDGNGFRFPDKGYAHQVMLSQTTMNRLKLKNGDSIIVYFLNAGQDMPRIRKLEVCGQYHTGMDEIDRSFAFCDIRLLQRMSNWPRTAISGYQIAISDYRAADPTSQFIYKNYLSPPLYASTMSSIYPNIFNWLALMNTNAYIILIIMAVVAVINMTTALLIFILERTNMIGILKTLGMPGKNIQKIFLYHAGIVAVKGILWGSLIGIALCLLQQHFHLLQLDESAYYMQYAPVKIRWWHIVLIDAGTLAFSMIILLVSSLFVRHINILKAIRFK